MDGNKSDKPEKKLQRKLFSIEEDAKLRFLVSQYGNKDFKKIATFMPGRTPRQVRERYKNYLSPEVNNGPWSREEDALLCQKYMELGPKWSKIADFFPSRSDINIKNRWTSIKGTQPISQNYKSNVNNIPNNPLPKVFPQPPSNYTHAMPILSNQTFIPNYPLTSINSYPQFNNNPYFNAYGGNAYPSVVNSIAPPKIESNPVTDNIKPDPLEKQEEASPPSDYFCDMQEFDRDDTNFMFSFDNTLNAEQQNLIFDFEI